eukprot:8641405-Lingulodinium_polyedra.AAC.1
MPQRRNPRDAASFRRRILVYLFGSGQCAGDGPPIGGLWAGNGRAMSGQRSGEVRATVVRQH